MKTILNSKKVVIILVIFLGILGIFLISKDNNLHQAKQNTNPYYYGVGESNLGINEISKLNKEDKEIDKSISITVSPVNQVWYLAYPDKEPVIKKIIDSNGFDLINDFKVSEGNEIINQIGEKISYRIYEFKNITTLNSYQITYNQ